MMEQRCSAGPRHLLREHRLILISCCAMCIVLILSFLILRSSVRSITQSARQLREAQLGSALEQAERLFENYRRLCSLLGANEEVKQLAAFHKETPNASLKQVGYALQKALNSLVSVYGSDINNLALYFPTVGSVVTIARNLHGEETSLFWDRYDEMAPEILLGLSRGTWWNPQFISNGSRSWIVHRTEVEGYHTVFVLIEYNWNSSAKNWTGGSEEMLLFTGTAGQCVFSTGAAPEPEVWAEMTGAPGAVTAVELFEKKYFSLTAASCLPDMYLSALLPAEDMERFETLFMIVVFSTAGVVLIGLVCMTLYLNLHVFTPLQKLSRQSHSVEDNISKTLSTLLENYQSLEHNQDHLLKERDLLIPLALGRQLVHLSQNEKKRVC